MDEDINKEKTLKINLLLFMKSIKKIIGFVTLSILLL